MQSCNRMTLTSASLPPQPTRGDNAGIVGALTLAKVEYDKAKPSLGATLVKLSKCKKVQLAFLFGTGLLVARSAMVLLRCKFKKSRRT